MDSLPFETVFLMSWVGAGLRGLLLAFLFGAIAWSLANRRVRHVAALTWKTAFRLRFIWVMILLLVVIVGGLPAVLRDDGSAKGMAQIILTYTLSMTTGILGFATLWLAVGSMARDIGDCQMQMVATKPIARWQIWLGKWLGIMGLNLMLLWNIARAKWMRPSTRCCKIAAMRKSSAWPSDRGSRVSCASNRSCRWMLRKKKS
jgi:hypothetical protein